MALGVVRDGMGIVGGVGLELADAFAERLDIRVPGLDAFKARDKVVDAGKGRTGTAEPIVFPALSGHPSCNKVTGGAPQCQPLDPGKFCDSVIGCPCRAGGAMAALTGIARAIGAQLDCMAC